MRPARVLLKSKHLPLTARIRALQQAQTEASSPSPSQSAVEAKPPRPAQSYIIQRTTTGNLPVYSDIRNDGSVKTIIRRIQGDIPTFQHKLNEYLRELHIDPLTNPPQATLKPTNQQLVIKGMHVETVKEFMLVQGH